MKKIIAAFCALLTATMLCSCINVEVEAVSFPEFPQTEAFKGLQSAAPTPSPDISAAEEGNAAAGATDSGEITEDESEMPAASVEEAVNVIVQYSFYEQKFNAPDNDGICILDFSYAEPSVLIDGQPEISDDINEIIALTNEVYYSGDESNAGISYSYEAALDAYSYTAQTGEQVNYRFFSDRVFKTLRADGKYISFLIISSSFLGDEEDYTYSGLTFSVADGSEVTPDDYILNRAEFTAAVSRYFTETYNIDAEPSDNMISDIIGLSDIGIVFSPLRYNASDILTVPYAAFTGIVSEEIIPDSYIESGDVTIAYASMENENDTEIVSCVIHDDNGDNLLLSAEGAVYNIRISEVTYIDDSFYETDELWYSDYLNNCGVQIKTILPEGMPNIRVQYQNSDHEIFSRLISWDGHTGAPTLIDDSVSAVG